jgi:hypothetical protein
MSFHGLGFSLVYATAIGAAQKWFPASVKVNIKRAQI